MESIDPMPTLKIQTNVQIAPERRKVVLEAASSTVAEQLAKPESYVMVVLETNQDMLFAADDAPLAYLELKSLGLPEADTSGLSAALCSFMEHQFGVPPARIYIEFSSPPRHMFGWNGGTF
ncbi:MAG: phenylpyruvate tautomerase MIF-related protein [Pseudomonadota bacterium]|nr:phenylpyruvate tautomerase MIF-related protein [Pseudomonadota bacterium]